MEHWQPMATELQVFVADDSGGALMEYTLIAALAVVVGALVVLALRKLTVAPV